MSSLTPSELGKSSPEASPVDDEAPGPSNIAAPGTTRDALGHPDGGAEP